MKLVTPRLVLRRWKNDDFGPFAEMNADPTVMEFYPKLLTRDESDASIYRFEAHLDQHGFGFWAVEAVGVAPFIGFTGLNIPSYEMACTPCVEIGWRLAQPFWGKGYATEAARAALQFGFRTLGFPQVVAFTVPANLRSQAVMRKLGMRYCPDEDFDHPLVPEGNPMRRHVLYRITRKSDPPR